MVLGAFCFVVLIVCGSLQLSMYLSPNFSPSWTLGIGILMVAMSIVGLVMCALCGRKFKREGFRVWDVKLARKVVLQPSNTVS